MTPSKKQELYLDITGFILPSMRNLYTWKRRWVIWKAGNFLPELELVHNLPQLMINPEFEAWDIHWLNSQAKQFVINCPKHRAYYNRVCRDIKELFALVPDNLRNELRWDGPQ
jgi:hypothetical protein